MVPGLVCTVVPFPKRFFPNTANRITAIMIITVLPPPIALVVARLIPEEDDEEPVLP